jgi:hypothetical protein
MIVAGVAVGVAGGTKECAEGGLFGDSCGLGESAAGVGLGTIGTVVLIVGAATAQRPTDVRITGRTSSGSTFEETVQLPLSRSGARIQMGSDAGIYLAPARASTARTAVPGQRDGYEDLLGQ